MKILLINILLLNFFITVQSQPYLGTWTSYLPYSSGNGIAVAGNKVYCSTNGGLFYYNKSDNSLNKFSKENGLSDSNISSLGWSDATSTLIIAYKNANIDILQGNKIYNLPDIMRKTDLLGDKNIYSIFIKENIAYLACGFGIQLLNLERKEFSETYKIREGSGLKVNSVCLTDEKIYAATDEGLFFADLNSPNLLAYDSWEKDPRFSNSDVINSITSSNSDLFLSVRFLGLNEDSILQNTSGTWEKYPYFQDITVPFLKSIGDQLLICSYFHVDIFEKDGNNSRHVFTGSPVMAELDGEKNIWIADTKEGLIRFPDQFGPETIIPEGPADIDVFDLNYSKGNLICAAGGATSSWNNLFRKGEIYTLNQNKWANWNSDSIKDILKIEIDPQNPDHYFAASWGYGLVEFLNGEITNLYREDNSSLQTIIPSEPYIRLGGLSYDRFKNLWVTNSGVGSPVSVLTPEGDWYSFELSGKINAPNLGDIIVTQNNHKWIILVGGKGLFAFDDKKTFENPDDDESLKFSLVDKNNDVITNEVYSIAEDRDGNIWVGTNQGPLVYYSPGRIFDEGNFYAQQIIIPRNDGSGLGDPLLGTESVTCIEVDGANRKWLGTKDGGVFLVSDDGLEQIHEFNTLNSPLLSNSIIDITIADETGEVFIATDNGIISFIGDATQPDDAFNDVYVFPNPVREDYDGDVVIAGLVEETFVKITDLNGNLVYETKSLGGQAIWNGKNYLGDRVSTGVYLVFCSTSDGLQTFVTKLLFIH